MMCIGAPCATTHTAQFHQDGHVLNWDGTAESAGLHALFTVDHRRAAVSSTRFQHGLIDHFRCQPQPHLNAAAVKIQHSGGLVGTRGGKAVFCGRGRSTGGQLDGDPGGEAGILSQQAEVRIERATAGLLGHRLE